MSEFVDPRAAPGRPATPVSVSAISLRKAWAADLDQRFTFAVLRELAVAAQSGDDAAVRAIVERTLNERERPWSGRRSWRCWRAGWPRRSIRTRQGMRRGWRPRCGT